MLTEKQLKEMIGDKPYYLKAYKKLREENKNTFNGAAMFCNVLWFIYRRMFLLGFLMNFLFLSIFLLLIVFVKNIFFSAIFSITFYSIIGFYGNKIYFYFIEKMHSKNYKNIGPIKRSLYISLITMVLLQIITHVLAANNKVFVTYLNLIFVAFISNLSHLLLLWLFSGEKRKAVFFFPFYKK